MTLFLRQSTAGQDVVLGPFVDDVDFKSPEVSLTIINTDVKLFKDGAASVDKNSGGGTHRGSGAYSFTFDATDTSTVGQLLILIDVAGALAVWVEAQVIEEAVYDIQYAAASTGEVPADVIKIDSVTSSAQNLSDMYDGTGYTDDEAPAKQSQLASIANVGSAVHKTSNGFTDTLSGTIVNAYTDTEQLNGIRHEIPGDVSDDIDVEYLFSIGSGTPSSVTLTGTLNGNGDSIQVQAYDYVTAGFKQIGTVTGKNSTSNEVDSYDLFVDMVGSAADEGKIRIRFFSTTTLSASTLYVDQIFIAFSQGVEGYDNGAIWFDSNYTNGNVEVGIDGVARNPVDSVADVNTMLASTNLHRVQVSPGASATFAATQTDETWEGRDWTLALNSANITGSFVFGATVTGTCTATGKYEFEECDIGTVTMDNDGYFEQCALSGTFTVGQAGTFTFHDCFTLAASSQVIDFAAVGATTIHLFAFHGEVELQNMAAGDIVHITGAGQITVNANCANAIVNHDGLFEYTDNGTSMTENKADMEVAVDGVKVETDKLTFTSGTDLDVNIQKVNDIVIVGDGEIGTPWGPV
jgi:hypothetical protein